MSKRYPIIALATLVLGGLCLHSLNELNDSIDMSSYANQKALVFKKAHHKHGKHQLHQKIKAPLEVHIKGNVSEIRSGETFIIKAEVFSGVETNNVSVKWNIPEFVKVHGGEIETFISHLPAGEVVELELVLESFSEENQQVHVIANAPFGDNVWSASDQFNTTMEEVINHKKKALAERNLEYMHKIRQ